MLTNNLLSPERKEYFILDPAFPERLTISGYKRTLEFIHLMFSEYAQAGLSKKSDKEVALSGLLRRMQDSLRSKCVYGTFCCFLSRLLLWRVSNATDSYTGDNEHQLPSWSWMSHNHIEFFPEEPIQTPIGINRLGSDGQLHVHIFKLRREQCELHVVSSDDEGEFWFDSQEECQVHYCVVVGKLLKNDMYFVLLVMEIDDRRYKRLGVGKTRPCYISDASFQGVLI